MFRPDAIHPVSEFSRKPAEFVKRLKATKTPEILTVNGKAELVIQDAETYQDMRDLLESLEAISKAVKEHEAGLGAPAKLAFDRIGKSLRAKYPNADF